MPSTFTDSQDREWTVAIRVGTLRKCKSKGLDLCRCIEELDKYLMDELFIVDAIWNIIELEAKGKDPKVSKEGFELAMDGTSIAAARDALWSSLEEWFDEKKSRMLREALAAAEAEIEKALSDLAPGNSLPEAKVS